MSEEALRVLFVSEEKDSFLLANLSSRQSESLKIDSVADTQTLHAKLAKAQIILLDLLASPQLSKEALVSLHKLHNAPAQR